MCADFIADVRSFVCSNDLKCFIVTMGIFASFLAKGRAVVSSRCLNWIQMCTVVGNREMIIHHEPAVSVVIVTVVINPNDTKMAHNIMLLLHLLRRLLVRANKHWHTHTQKQSSPTLTMQTFKKICFFRPFYSCLTCQYALLLSTLTFWVRYSTDSLCQP